MNTNSVEKIDLNHASFRDLITQFTDIKNNALSGNTIVRVESEPSRMFSFNVGKLVGVSGGVNSTDCWRRSLEAAKLQSPPNLLIENSGNQKIPLPVYAIAQKLVAIEVIFDLIQICQSNKHQLSYQFIPIEPSNFIVNPKLILLSIQPILDRAIQNWQEWQNAGLSDYFPNEFLNMIDSVKLLELMDIDDSLEVLLSIDGKKSLRDLAADSHQNLLDFTTRILPSLKEKAISLSSSQIDPIETNNLDLHLAKSSISTMTKKVGSLIACIDNSISTCNKLEKFLVEQGYRFCGIQDSLKVITTLLEDKPDLIFLDLSMPIINGYEVCQQIRKTPTIKDTPILILTAKDGLFDRMRAKAIGANEFLRKPISHTDLLEVIGKYL
jgi:two-component system, chemotaxis family, response regulator PixG